MNPEERMDDLRTQISHEIVVCMNAWRDTHANVSPTIRRALDEFEAARRDAVSAARKARGFAENAMANDEAWPLGRAKKVGASNAQAQDEYNAAIRRMQMAQTIIAKSARSAATPKLDPSREMAARDELRMLADASDDPLAVLERVAGSGGELAAVACTRWGESYLRARGVTHAPEMHGAVQDAAVLASCESSDPELRAAGEAMQAVGDFNDIMLATTDEAGDEFGVAQEHEAALVRLAGVDGAQAGVEG